MILSWGSKFVAIVFSFIIHIKSYHFVGSGIHGSDPPRKPQKFKPSTVYKIHHQQLANEMRLYKKYLQQSANELRLFRH